MNIKTVLFALTFVPYALVILGGILGAIRGVDFFFSRCYKCGGFLLGALASLAYMTIVPVIPVCIVFHVLCLLRKNVSFIRNIGAKEFDTACAVICAAVFITLLIRSYLRHFKKSKTKRMSAKTDEKTGFNKSTVYSDGICRKDKNNS